MNTAFAVGTGRCGTKFLYELFNGHPGVDAHHEQAPLSDTFLRYATWYRLPVDLTGCWSQKAGAVAEARNQGKAYFESSAYLSLNIMELYERFDAKVILLVREPTAVIRSYQSKGWYANPLLRENPNLAAGPQPYFNKPHHHFSRIAARGEEGREWDSLTQVGQLAWFWRTINQAVLDSFSTLPADRSRVVRIEDLDYTTYLSLCQWLNWEPPVSERTFDRLVRKKPNKKKLSAKSVAPFGEQAQGEVHFFTAELAKQLGYPL